MLGERVLILDRSQDPLKLLPKCCSCWTPRSMSLCKKSRSRRGDHPFKSIACACFIAWSEALDLRPSTQVICLISAAVS